MRKKKPSLAEYDPSPLSALSKHKARQDAPEPESADAKPKADDRKDTHTQISAYIPKELYRDVRKALAGRDDKLTLTDVLIKLLSDWVKEQER